MAFKKILCPVDFSAGSLPALEVAVRLATEHGAELTVAHAWHVPGIAMSELTLPADTIQQMHDDAKRGLDQALADARTNGAQHATAKLLMGVPWLAITEELGDPAYDLVVVGSHGRTGVARVVMGSVAEKVIRHAPCSVLVVRPDAEARPFERVLCPIDFSEGSREAMYLAGDLARQGGGQVTLLHAVELPVAWSFELPTPQLERELGRTATAMLTMWADELKRRTDVTVSTRPVIGAPGLRTLEELDADPTVDLIVMGSHGRTGLKRLLLGSVAEQVARHARCPVLVARTRD